LPNLAFLKFVFELPSQGKKIKDQYRTRQNQ
jgi:hypothetical protein